MRTTLLRSLLAASGLFLVSTLGMAQTPSSLGALTAKTSAAPAVTASSAPSSSRLFVLPSRTVNLTAVSSVEAMYAKYGTGSAVGNNSGSGTSTGNLSQFGYSTFTGPLAADQPRGKVPEPYTLGTGDQLTVLLWGDPVDLGDLSPQFTSKIEGDGTFFYPPVGQVRADGFLRSDLEKSLAVGLAKKYKRFDLRLQVNPLHVFPLVVTGLVAQPGSVLVDPWTNLLEVLAQVGGIEKTGTLRSLKLVKADGREVPIDLYDLLIHARKPAVKFDEGDTLWVGPIGRTSAVAGNVKVPGIFEVKPGETLADLMSFAGGPLVSANGAPVTKVGWSDGEWIRSASLWDPAQFASTLPQDGDLYQYGGPVDVKVSGARPGFIKVGGEVAAPGFVEWTEGTTLGQILEKAGGLTSQGYLPGLVVTRQSVAEVQKAQVISAIQENTLQIATAQARLQKAVEASEIAALTQELGARTSANKVLNDSLTNGSLGRIQLESGGASSIILQPGDVVNVPRQSGVVILVGEVFNAGAQVWSKGMTVRGALDAVGGVTPNGNWDGVYVVRASGKVDSVRARGNFLGMSSLWGEALQPGDVVYVPLRPADSNQAWAAAKDILTILATTTTTTSNIFVVLKTTGLL